MLSSVPDFGHSDRCVVVSHCCFSLHFPDDICLFAICIFFLVRYLFRSLTHFLFGLVVFLLLNFRSSFYVIGNSYL